MSLSNPSKPSVLFQLRAFDDEMDMPKVVSLLSSNHALVSLSSCLLSLCNTRSCTVTVSVVAAAVAVCRS